MPLFKWELDCRHATFAGLVQTKVCGAAVQSLLMLRPQQLEAECDL